MSTPTHKRSTDYTVGDTVTWNGVELTKKRDVVPMTPTSAEDCEIWETKNKSQYFPTLDFTIGNSLPAFLSFM